MSNNERRCDPNGLRVDPFEATGDLKAFIAWRDRHTSRVADLAAADAALVMAITKLSEARKAVELAEREHTDAQRVVAEATDCLEMVRAYGNAYWWVSAGAR